VALATGSVLATLALAAAAAFGWHLARHWDPESGSARQLRLERRTWLLSSLLGLVVALQALTLPFTVHVADRLSGLLTGAMCAVGAFRAVPGGFAVLYLDLAVLLLAVPWLVLNHLDQRTPGFPATRVKYRLLLPLLGLVAAATVLRIRWLTGIDADVITSCCGSVFGARAEGLGADLAALPPVPALALFFAGTGAAALGAAAHARLGRGAGAAAVLGLGGLAAALAGMVSFLSLYVYEHPHHHCPFCLLQAEYGYRGYAFYLPLLGAAALGLAAWALAWLARRPGAAPALGRSRRLAGAAAVLWLWVMLWAAHAMWASNLILLPGP
jgi:hypothetical protein